MLDTGLYEPTAISFTSVINGFAATSRPAEASKWLMRMLNTKSVAPDTVAFNTVLNAYAQAGDAAGALRMMDFYEKHVVDECPAAKPDLVSYNTLITACARAKLPKQVLSLQPTCS